MMKTTSDSAMSDPSPSHIEALQEQRFSSFLEAAPDAVVIIDQGGKIVRVNGQTERMFGLQQSDPTRRVTSHERGPHEHNDQPKDRGAQQLLDRHGTRRC